MNLLDEQIRRDQREVLTKWRIPFRQIGRELGSFGILDPNILPILHHLKRPTLFTHDQDFFNPQLAHRAYCIAWLDVPDTAAAEYIRAFLRHPRFKTHASRMGLIVRIHSVGIQFWARTHPLLQALSWQS